MITSECFFFWFYFSHIRLVFGFPFIFLTLFMRNTCADSSALTRGGEESPQVIFSLADAYQMLSLMSKERH